MFLMEIKYQLVYIFIRRPVSELRNVITRAISSGFNLSQSQTRGAVRRSIYGKISPHLKCLHIFPASAYRISLLATTKCIALLKQL